MNSIGSKAFGYARANLAMRAAQTAVEVALLTVALVLAYLLRFDFNIPSDELAKLWPQIAIVVFIQMSALRLFGTHRYIWRYTSSRDARSITAALVSAAIVLLSVRLGYAYFHEVLVIPISITVLDLFISLVGMLGVRMARREIYERSRLSRADISQRKPVILVGAGQAGVQTLAEIKRRGDLDLDVKAFVDDDASKQGAVINGVRVEGGTRDLPKLAERYGIDHVIISIAQASRSDFQRILKICRNIPIKVRTIPGLYELLQGNVTVSRIRNIEIEDLLGREAVKLDADRINAFLKGKTVMVTGAGGSIGSELVRQLTACSTGKLILVERSEPALFHIEREILERFPDINIRALIGDVSDPARMEKIFSRYEPDVVFHAAAHKHVPLMENNAAEALKNNVLGTRLVADLAGRYNAESFVLISTDKAVFPTSVMGASKRLAELVIQDLDRKYSTRFLAVRFGNVIGSNGSVIPIFREQIKRGGPVTVTHPEMSRYFMTIPEASQLVLEAGAIGGGGDIMILDMGHPVRILDLARETIRLSGLSPDSEIQIKFTGIRPGEKLTEVLESDAERLMKTVHPKIFVGKIAPLPTHRVVEILTSIPQLCAADNEWMIRKHISSWLPESRLTRNPAFTTGSFELNASGSSGPISKSIAA